MKQQSRRGRGFTLAELLIVVAIIAVLTAVAIPVFTAQLEKSREATDAANIRGQYAEVMTKANETGGDVNEDGGEFEKIPLKQKEEYWQNNGMESGLGSIAVTEGVGPNPGGKAWVSYSQTNGAVIHFEGGTESDAQEQQDQQQQQDQTQQPKSIDATAQDIADTVGPLILGAKNYAENPLPNNFSAQVTIKLNPNGTYEISTKHTDPATSQLVAEIKRDLDSYFAANENHPNDFAVWITINNGHGGSYTHDIQNTN